MKQIIILISITILIVLGIIFQQHRLYFLLSSGVLLGIYYGFYNDIIWTPKAQLQKSVSYRIHQIWIHVICAIVGSLALYFLLADMNFFSSSTTLEKLGTREFFLLLIAVLGYTGLFPRVLWFYSNRGGS